MTADDTLLVVEDVDGVRTITINRPEVKNALTAAMRARFCELVDEAETYKLLRGNAITAFGLERFGITE